MWQLWQQAREGEGDGMEPVPTPKMARATVTLTSEMPAMHSFAFYVHPSSPFLYWYTHWCHSISTGWYVYSVMHFFSSSLPLSLSPPPQAVPTNTPATPPQLMDTLQQLEHLNTSSPSGGDSFEPTIVKCHTKAGERWTVSTPPLPSLLKRDNLRSNSSTAYISMYSVANCLLLL